MKRFLFACVMCIATTLSANDLCDVELLKAFYPPEFVEATLKEHDIPEANRKAIILELKRHERNVVARVEERASKMNPNPLDEPDRRAAVQLFSQSINEIFAEVLKQQGITDEAKINAMMTEINNQKLERFKHCLETTPQ